MIHDRYETISLHTKIRFLCTQRLVLQKYYNVKTVQRQGKDVCSIKNTKNTNNCLKGGVFTSITYLTLNSNTYLLKTYKLTHSNN